MVQVSQLCRVGAIALVLAATVVWAGPKEPRYGPVKLEGPQPELTKGRPLGAFTKLHPQQWETYYTAMERLFGQALTAHGARSGVKSPEELKKAEVQCGLALAGHHIAQAGARKHREKARSAGIRGEMREAALNTELGEFLEGVEGRMENLVRYWCSENAPGLEPGEVNRGLAVVMAVYQGQDRRPPGAPPPPQKIHVPAVKTANDDTEKPKDEEKDVAARVDELTAKKSWGAREYAVAVAIALTVAWDVSTEWLPAP